MAGWSEQKVKQALRCPSNVRVMVLFALGYGADVKSVWENLDERTENKLARPRERKPLDQNFFSESYGESLFGSEVS
jgi:hypothetical protein